MHIQYNKTNIMTKLSVYYMSVLGVLIICSYTSKLFLIQPNLNNIPVAQLHLKDIKPPLTEQRTVIPIENAVTLHKILQTHYIHLDYT